jgi:hypothetical protein
MTEKMEGLLNNARTSLTRLYPDETLSRAMFAIMEVLEEVSAIAPVETKTNLVWENWAQSMTLRMNKLDSIHNSINQALENVLNRICNLEDKYRNVGQPSEKWNGLENLIRNTASDLRELKNKNDTMIEHFSDMVEELED